MTVKIVPSSIEYAPLIHKWRNEPATLKFNPVKPRTLEEIRDILLKSVAVLNPLDKSIEHRWFVETGNEIVGTVFLSGINAMMGTAEIGYMVGEQYYGRGIATAAVKTWTDMIFELTDLRKLTASVAEGNLASLRVLEKAGYKREGLLREHYIVQGEPTNEIVFGLLRGDWS